MALRASAIELLAPFIRGDVLCLSYPDILIPSHVAEEAGYTVTRTTPHGERYGIAALPETTEFLTQCGAESVRYVDFLRTRGVEEILDLNEPQELGKYDLVIDPGTLEHCFNVGQAIVNATKAVKVGGSIFTVSPMTMVNHGFWNFSPTAWFDFYRENGFRLKAMASAVGDVITKVHPFNRFTGHQDAVLYCLAERVSEHPVRWPTQTKYKATHMRYQQMLDEVSRKQPKVICEIGTWTGDRAIQMLQRAPDATYYGFDIFEGADEAHREEEFSHKKPTTEAEVAAKLEGYKTHLIVGNTRETLKTFKPHAPIDFLWLDGGHSVETIRGDWENIKRHLAPDATVFFDDYFSDGPDTLRFGCNEIVKDLPHEVLPLADPVIDGGTTQVVKVSKCW